MGDEERDSLRLHMILSLVVAALLDAGLPASAVLASARTACIRWAKTRLISPERAKELADRTAAEANRLAEEASG